MYNELFSIGPFTIHGYGLMIGIGFIAALTIGSFRAKKRGLDSEFLFNLAVLCLIFGMIGSKLLYVLTVLDKIIANPSDFLSLSNGFVVYGGIISGIFTGMIYCKIKGKSFTDYFDIVMPSISIAQGFGRIGCFLAGCCYGRETDAWYGITFTHSHYAPNNVSLIPTQLISSAGNFLIAGILILIARKQRKPGLIASLYLIFYGTGRFAVEMLRGDIERGSIGALSTSQFISIFIVLAGIAYLIYVLKFSKAFKNIDVKAPQSPDMEVSQSPDMEAPQSEKNISEESNNISEITKGTDDTGDTTNTNTKNQVCSESGEASNTNTENQVSSEADEAKSSDAEPSTADIAVKAQAADTKEQESADISEKSTSDSAENDVSEETADCSSEVSEADKTNGN